MCYFQVCASAIRLHTASQSSSATYSLLTILSYIQPPTILRYIQPPTILRYIQPPTIIRYIQPPTIISYLLKASQPSSATYSLPPSSATYSLPTIISYIQPPTILSYIQPPNHHQLHTASHHPQPKPSPVQHVELTGLQPDLQPPKGLQETKLSLPKALSVWDQPALAAMQCSMGTKKFPNNPVQQRGV